MSSDEESEISTPGYKVSEKVGMEEIAGMDQDDESLKRYKEALLGAALEGDLGDTDDTRRVVIREMRVICNGRPDGDIVYDLKERDSEKQMKSSPFTLKEKCEYKISVKFNVQHEIVSGLKLVNFIRRKGVKVAREQHMLGSFAPQTPVYEVVFPRHGWDEAPSGMMARGQYTGKHKFIDDDGQNHLEYEYAFAIKKGWS